MIHNFVVTCCPLCYSPSFCPLPTNILEWTLSTLRSYPCTINLGDNSWGNIEINVPVYANWSCCGITAQDCWWFFFFFLKQWLMWFGLNAVTQKPLGNFGNYFIVWEFGSDEDKSCASEEVHCLSSCGDGSQSIFKKMPQDYVESCFSCFVQ